MRATSVVSVGLVVVVSLACGGAVEDAKRRAEEKVAEQVAEAVVEHAVGKDAVVDMDGSNVTIKTGDGNFIIGDQAKIPSTVPKEFHPMSGGKVNVAAEQGDMTAVMYEIDKPASEVHAWHLKQAEACCSKLFASEDGQSFTSGWSTKDGRTATISVMSEEGKSVVAIGLTKGM